MLKGTLKGNFLIIDSIDGRLLSSKVYKSKGLAKRALNQYTNGHHYENYRVIEIPQPFLLELYENQHPPQKGE